MGDSKQVKVDNWGIFFLQRLQTFFNKTYFCDLTLQFDDNVQLKVHRLVMNACTEYFQVLEQTCEVINDCLIMPPDLQADVVVPIVNFMYTGILEFQMSIFDRLYTTARLMNMTVLTKLLDAQKVPISPMPKQHNKRSPISPITWNLQGKKISPKTMDPDLPEPLPGRKLPIWKRKSVPSAIAYRSDLITGLPDPLSSKYFRPSVDETPKPTRFEWPDDEESNFDTNSFNEISYTSKPIMMPQREKSPKPSTSSNNFEELKRTSVAVKRSASPIYNDSKKVNIQDVKEYIKEQKLRSDYIDYDDAEAADNDLQTYENNHDTDEDNTKEDIFEQNEDSPNKSILKNDTSASHNKRVRFSLEGKENAAKTPQKITSATVKSNTASVDLTNHTKIITEVLKKYPHLVKKNKNIRLKILAKGANTQTAGLKPIGTPLKMVKPAVKVNYMVMKPGGESAVKTVTPDKKDGHWSCHKCSNPNPLIFETYYLYRKHLTDVHNEKTDSQMCNICGHISRKQNLLMYHKLVKHDFAPSPSYHFPKCKDCPYIALSAAMLNKHQLIHTHQSLACAECNTAFQNKSALISHVQLTGHTDKNNCPTYDCTYCTKKFISDETLFQHIKNNHKIEARRDNIISQLEEEDPQDRKENIITAEEIDAMDEKDENKQNIVTHEFVEQGIVAQEFVQQEIVTQEFVQQEFDQQETLQHEIQEKPKEKIKILSDVKVTTLKNTKLQPVKVQPTQEIETTSVVESQPLEPSSEAESLSNVASGIAASLGLVNAIVVLDENQFILQSQDGNQDNPQNIILPDNINNIQNLVSQHQVITTDANTIISQATLGKNNIASTDELVMVLTDHDYSDAANNAVITSENSNIVVLYSHPVQTQDGQYMSQPGNLMINSNMGLVEVGNNYTVNTVEKCEESIELIQQEINNQLDEQEIAQNGEKIADEEIIEREIEHQPNEIVEHTEEKMEIDPVDQQEQEQFENQVPSQETESTVSETLSEEIKEVHECHDDNNYEEPMEIEESIHIQNSVNLQEMQENSVNLQQIQEISEENPETVSEDVSPNISEENIQEKSDIQKELEVIDEETEELQETNEQEEEQIEAAETTEDKTHESQVITKQELIKEHQEEDIEHMEVDSSKLTEDSISLENQIVNIEPTNQQTNVTAPEELTSDLGEDRSQDTEDLHRPGELQQEENILLPIEHQEITSVNDEINLGNQDKNTQESIEKEIDNMTEETIVEPEIKSQQNNEIIQETVEAATEETVDDHCKSTEEHNVSAEDHIETSEDLISATLNHTETPENLNETSGNVNETTEDLNETVEDFSETIPEVQELKISEEIRTQESKLSQDLECSFGETTEKSEETKVTTTLSTVNNTESPAITNSKISNLLDDWDDGDTDSQQSDNPKPQTDISKLQTDNTSSINTLINDWEDDEES